MFIGTVVVVVRSGVVVIGAGVVVFGAAVDVVGVAVVLSVAEAVVLGAAGAESRLLSCED